MAKAMVTTVTVAPFSWLQSSGIAAEVQQMIESLPLKDYALFSSKMDEALHTLKDSRAVLKFLGLYIQDTKRTKYHPQYQSRQQF